MKSTKRKFSISKLQKVAKILKTISHPVKLEILEILESNEPLTPSGEPHIGSGNFSTSKE